MQNIISQCDIAVFGVPKTNPLPIIILCAIVLIIMLISGYKWLKNQAENQPFSDQNNIDPEIKKNNSHGKCHICNNPSGEYELCPKCFELLQNGELKRCNNCGKWYQKGTICNCIKTKKE